MNHSTSDKVVNVLKQYISFLEYSGELQYKINSYKKAIVTLTNLPNPLHSATDFSQLQHIGKSIDAKIREIINTGTLSHIPDTFASDEKVLRTFTKIVNIGPATAKKWLKQGIRSLSELKEAIHTGKVEHANVEHWIKYIDGPIVMKDSIPRQEMQQLVKIITTLLKEFNPDLRIHICGSYRRNKPVSNDIDIIIVDPKYETAGKLNRSKQLVQIIKFLIEKKVLFDHLTHKIDKLTTKYMGLVPSPDNPHVVRRIDIRMVPVESEATAILYFTGSMRLNQQMRTVAKEQGMLLNEYCLKKLDSSATGAKIKTKINITSEKDIFELLGMTYLKPEERDL